MGFAGEWFYIDLKSKMNKSSSLLLPREKYGEASQKWGKLPLMLEIENEKQVLFYFGANHSKEPKNAQFPILRQYWEKFLKKTKDEERIILVEGGLRPLAKNEELAIVQNSEGGFITYISNESNTMIASPDLNQNDILLRFPEINKDELLLYFFMSHVDSYHRISDPKPDFGDFFENWAKYQRTREVWLGLEISLEYLTELYKSVMDKEFNQNESQNDYINPNNSGTRINKLARKISDARDENIINEIEKYWKEGKSIFVVFGSGHLIIQEPALRALLK
ncbi:MAG: Uncharacterized protein CEO12_647 [Parcubacteria group bacterium Gr01-1014_46]|nr:MAG: Uncharacterized protein CEO12_647 [Parcubacteria group bacterium Gr01-1014_46]